MKNFKLLAIFIIFASVTTFAEKVVTEDKKKQIKPEATVSYFKLNPGDTFYLGLEKQYVPGGKVGHIEHYSIEQVDSSYTGKIDILLKVYDVMKSDPLDIIKGVKNPRDYQSGMQRYEVILCQRKAIKKTKGLSTYMNTNSGYINIFPPRTKIENISKPKINLSYEYNPSTGMRIITLPVAKLKNNIYALKLLICKDLPSIKGWLKATSSPGNQLFENIPLIK